MPDTGRERRAGLAILLTCLLAFGYFVYRGPHDNPDSRLALTYALVEQSRAEIDDFAGTTEDRAFRAGHYYTDKAPGVSFLLVPLYAVLRLAHLPDTPDRFVTRYVLTYFGLGIPAAAFCVWLFHWLRRYEAGIAPRMTAVLGLALGSPFWAYSIAAFGHVPAAIALFAGFALLLGPDTSTSVIGPKRVAPAGFALSWAVFYEYPAALPALTIGLLATIRLPGGVAGRLSRLAWLVAGALPPLAALAVYHSVAFGAPWITGYGFVDPGGPYASLPANGFMGVGFPDPGVALALLIGLQRGLLVTAPWLLLALPGVALTWRRGEQTAVAATGGTLALLLAVNAGYPLWHGGAAWGPRYLVPALPFISLWALPALARWPRTSSALVAVSIAMTLAAVATQPMASPEIAVPLFEYVLPRAISGEIGANWGYLAGLRGALSLLPPVAAVVALLVWARWPKPLRHPSHATSHTPPPTTTAR